MTHDLTAADLEVLRSARAKCTTQEMYRVLEVVDKLLHDAPLRRCLRCGERVRAEGDTILCDGVVSKLAPISTHTPVTYNGTSQPLSFEPIEHVKEIVETTSGEVLWTAPYCFNRLHKSGETFIHDRISYTVISHSMENGTSRLIVEVSRPVIIDEIKEHNREKVEMLMREQKEKLGS